MKKLLTISLLALLSACGGQESESTEAKNILENLTYSVDTVMVDAGDDLFNLSFGIRSLDLSEDGKRLFYFENMPPKLLQVDLESKKLLGKKAFEVEGPNGIGSFVAKIDVGPDGKLFLMGNTGLGIFDQSGTKVKDLKIEPEGIDSELAKNFFSLYGNSFYDWENQKIYAWPLDEGSETLGLISIDLQTKTAKIIDTPEMEIVKKYSILSEDNGSFQASAQRVYLSKHDEKILIACSAMGDLYEYDPQTDNLKFIEINHQLVPNRLSGEVTNQLHSSGDFLKEMARINSQIIYQDPKWDKSRNLFSRLAMKVLPGNNPDEPNKYEYYLLAYDQNFNLLGESKLELKDRIDYSFFWKDGKLYSYVNVEDVLGFAVFTFDF
ncbi:DUF4221 family protein [Algoriphagus antarcticus]|uniref:Uncharacterized protein DUF4221 n=1 Tax=Algoriphagus antarcticus TaxID=238540 RepID=A0A3E0DW66_9BACT|nr:DUF4221 family protein [Algoriphagus antarcticus]REG86301.1 uncharacterized protein DUF4221 [Algoriphagus antarcticus]